MQSREISEYAGKNIIKHVSADDKGKDVAKLESILEKSHHVLFKTGGVFPFELFPDTLTIDRKKLTVVHNAFFQQKQTVSVPLEDITNVQADLGPFLGSVTITSEHFMNNTQSIHYLPRKDAIELQGLLQGMIIAIREQVNLEAIEEEELVTLLRKLGRSNA